MSADNKTLAKFELAPIPPAPRGVPEVEVTLRDRRRTASCNVLREGPRLGPRAEASTWSSLRVASRQDQVEQASSRDAESVPSDADEKRRELAELRKQSAEALLYTSERAVD